MCPFEAGEGEEACSSWAAEVSESERPLVLVPVDSGVERSSEVESALSWRRESERETSAVNGRAAASAPR
jgi:hypothetical protein